MRALISRATGVVCAWRVPGTSYLVCYNQEARPCLLPLLVAAYYREGFAVYAKLHRVCVLWEQRPRVCAPSALYDGSSSISTTAVLQLATAQQLLAAGSLFPYDRRHTSEKYP